MMESVQTRKLGNHLFIFEKSKDENQNGGAKGRTFITSCEAKADKKLPPEFIRYMRTLFNILDTSKSGLVKLSDIEAFWGQRDGMNGYSLQVRGVLEHLRKVTPANGLLSFERLCMGFCQSFHSSANGSIANGSVGASRANVYENRDNDKLKGQNYKSGFTRRQQRDRPRSMGPLLGKSKDQELFHSDEGRSFNKPDRERDSELCKNEFSAINGRRPISIGQNKETQPGSMNPGFHLNDTGRRPHSELLQHDINIVRKPERQKRPKSMLPFCQAKQPDLSVAKKQGGILEGIQKTDKKTVIAKLKQWRNEELKKSTSSGVKSRTKEFYGQGYQSDNEGAYNCRQRRLVTPVCCTGLNETGSEIYRNLAKTSRRSNGVPMCKTTVYYQGQVETKSEKQEPKKTRAPETLRTAQDDVKTTTGDELHTLKEGLHIVDEVRDCLLKRIADIQEKRLYENLNNTKSQDLKVKSSDEEKRKTPTSYPSDVESLSNLFRSLKTILDQVKPSRNDC
ncbi:uncharacterized protein LOC114518836 [Dendronephthya gigantea]|uniref:uncharacterized protein LOC114518836 n=1 Tax=Dendronephthya gigantea TaxID=151771 RepID=UPI001069E8B0|nr:uncharacterized protein LOC114518836 [Dendronephthya gigantea]